MQSGRYALVRPKDVDRDSALLHALFTIPAVYRYLADGVEPPPEIAAAWVAENPSQEALGLGLWLLKEVGGEDSALGCIRLAPTEEEGTAEVTYVLHPDLWGRGLATLAAGLTIQHAFQLGNISKVTAGADLPNRRSIEVMKRLGMSHVHDVQYPAGQGVEYLVTPETLVVPAAAAGLVELRTGGHKAELVDNQSKCGLGP